MWLHKDPDKSLPIWGNKALFGGLALFQIMLSWLQAPMMVQKWSQTWMKAEIGFGTEGKYLP